MLKNILSKSKTKSKPSAGNNVLADLRRVLKTGRRVGLMHDGQMLGKAIVVGMEKDYLLFEPFGPIDDLAAVSVVSNVERGVPWDFRVKELQKVREGSDVYLQCSIPTQININSRRTNFRVMAPASSEYELHFEIEEQEYQARLLDLSRSGAQIRMLGTEEVSLDVDQVIDKARLALDDFGVSEVDIKICWKVVSEDSIRIGVEFHNMSSAESDAIYRLVCEIERETIRRLKALEK